MKRFKTHPVRVVMVVCAAALPARAEPGPPGGLPEARLRQKLNAQLPLDRTFTDSAGRPVRLREFFHGKPVILSLVYYDCPMLCTLVLNGMVRSLRALPFTAGEEFVVLSVSIDPRETPSLAAGKRTTYLNKYARPGAGAGWHFLIGEDAAIRELADTVGFEYAWDEETAQYAHPAGIMVLTPDGRVARYFYGIEYPPRDLKLALMEASENRIGSAVDQVLLLCFQYDPTTGKYGLMIFRIMRVLGTMTVLGLGVFVFTMLRRERRSAAAGPAAPSA